MDDIRLGLSLDDLLVDHHLLHVAQAGQVVHGVEQHILEDGAQAAGAGLSLHGLAGHRAQRVLAKVELHAFHVEQLAILLGERVLRLQQDRNQRVLVQLLEGRHHRQAPDEFRNEAVLDQILGLGVVEHVIAVRPRVLFPHLRHETDPALVGAVHDDLFEACEGAAADEQDIGGVDLQEFLLRMLAAALRRHGGDGALDQLQKRLLHALARHVAGDRWVVGLARDLVDLVDVDDARLRLLDIVVALLQKLLDDVLDILADIACLGQGRGIGDRERHVQKPGERLGEKGLARAGGPDQEDVALGELDFIPGAHAAFRAAGLKPLVVVVDGDREHALGTLLSDHVLVQNLLDLLGLGQLVAGALGALLELFPDDVIAKLDAFVADEDRWSGDQLSNFVLALSTERAIQQLAVIMFAARIFAHAALKLAALLCRQGATTIRLYSTRPTMRKDRSGRGVTEVLVGSLKGDIRRPHPGPISGRMPLQAPIRAVAGPIKRTLRLCRYFSALLKHGIH